MNNKGTKYGIILLLLILALTGANLLFGSVNIPAEAVWHILTGNEVEKASWSFIVWESRLPQAITALLCGMALAASGLMLQTTFNNPLADPSILGISSGASMGVAFVVLLSGSLGGVALSKLGFMGEIALTIAAIAGSLSIMALIVFVSQKVRGNVTLLIIGVMIGYIANAVIGVLKFFSVEEDIRAYVIWGLGSFARVSGDQMTLMRLCQDWQCSLWLIGRELNFPLYMIEPTLLLSETNHHFQNNEHVLDAFLAQSKIQLVQGKSLDLFFRNFHLAPKNRKQMVLQR